MGFREVEENEDWSLFWTDTSVSVDRVNQMKRWQVNLNPIKVLNLSNKNILFFIENKSLSRNE